jgi:EAL domain-containing protein (putative c-di-GMP-specific phosphodiesterase class I)
MGLPNIVVSVNLSKHQLHNRAITQTIKQVLGMTGLESRGLELELTESVVMRDPDIAASMLGSIRDLGVRIAMDDFGTGYSCFSYLMQLPLDTLKIDKSFLENLSDNTRKAAIVRTIIALARHLKLQVVAEGVERPQQMRFLGEEGCDLVQGYFTGAPVSAEQFSQLLARVDADSAKKQRLVLQRI